MRSLLNFLIKYHVFFLFLFLEMFSLTLIVRYNNFQRVSFLNSSNAISATVFDRAQSVVDYFQLKRINETLSEENTRLRQQLQSLLLTDIENASGYVVGVDTVEAYSAKVIRNSVNKQYNYLTLNKGESDGIELDMGVVCADGVVGVVLDVSENYATVLSVLNGRWAINAKHKETNYFGPLQWGGLDPSFAYLEEIPYHVKINKGDEIVTSGYSSIFPEGISIGVVEEIEHSSGDTFQEVKVRLSVGFGGLFYVNVLKNTNKEERIELEKSTRNE
ncbi:MAG: rod shape-determining protein MreC [Prolixibacteraceae bacterium]|jgi:rod shape-determining protein MreC|nr:rod shape-determining protein MreC [Prolixibacteraceae bacterium]